MLTKRNLLLVGIVILLLLILTGGYVVYTIMGDYIIYAIKTFTQAKYKLTVYAVDRITGNPMKYVPIEVVRRIDSTEKKITYRKTNGKGIAAFRLPPGEYSCHGATGGYLGYTDFISLNKDREIEIKIWIPVQ